MYVQTAERVNMLGALSSQKKLFFSCDHVSGHLLHPACRYYRRSTLGGAQQGPHPAALGRGRTGAPGRLLKGSARKHKTGCSGLVGMCVRWASPRPGACRVN
jgi:hypothetical protein